MKPFLALNKHKLPFAYGVISLIFVVLVLLVFLGAAVIGNASIGIDDVPLIISVFLSAGIGMPVFILFAAYIEWLQNRYFRKRAFQRPPFNQLHTIGFKSALLHMENKWLFTEETLATIIHGFSIRCTVEKNKPNQLCFQASAATLVPFAKWAPVLKKHGIVLDFEGPMLCYNSKKPSVKTIESLQKNLEKMTEILLQQGFTPRLDKTI